jgi:hypothetical protein
LLTLCTEKREKGNEEINVSRILDGNEMKKRANKSLRLHKMYIIYMSQNMQNMPIKTFLKIKEKNETYRTHQYV